MGDSPSLGETIAAKKVHIYSNGDKFFAGRRFVINPRTTRNYESFLNQVTLSLKPSFGAVRTLRTPDSGSIVDDLQELESGRSYVACAGQKFVKIGYNDITVTQKSSNGNAPQIERRNRLIVSGRIKKIKRSPISVYVYTNGEVLEPARRVLLKPWVQKTWENVLQAISDKVVLRSGAVRHLVELTEKTEITEGAQLKNDGFYVAVGSEKFKELEYGMQPVILSPRQQQKKKYPSLAPLKKKGGSNSSTDELTPSDSNYQSSLENDSPVAKHDSATKSSQQALQHTSREERAPAKPQHKRSSAEDSTMQHAADERKPRNTNNTTNDKGIDQARARRGKHNTVQDKSRAETQIDLDQDNSGLFKSKHQKAKVAEVAEEDNVKTEVPIDHRPAKPVEEEELGEQKQKEEVVAVRNTLKPSPKKPSPPEESKRAQRKQSPREPKTQTKANIQLAKNHEPKPEESRMKKGESKQVNSEEKEKAAIKIQSTYRGYRTRLELKGKVAGIELTAQTDDSGVLDISAAEETAKREEATQDKSKRDTTSEDETKRDEAAIKIQSTYRGYRTRKQLAKEPKTENNAKELTDTHKLKQETAAIKIQAIYRGYKVNKDFKAKMKNRHTAAVTIQSNYRGYRARKDLKMKRGTLATQDIDEHGDAGNHGLGSDQDGKDVEHAAVTA